MTRRLWVALGLTLLLGIFSLSISQTRAEGLVIDQENETGNTGTITLNNHDEVLQSFKPSIGTIDKIDVYLKNRSAGHTIQLKLRDTGSGVLMDKSHRMGAGDGWEEFTADAPITVTPEQTYLIQVYTATANVGWAYNTGNQYTRGSCYFGNVGEPSTDDFWFKTYYTSSSAFDNESDTGTQTTTTSNTGTAMPTTTSSAIGKPSNLTAKFVDTASQRGVNLDWKKSSTDDIYGYTIFRSEKSTSGYTKVGEVIKETLSFLDSNIAASKTYYYQVRAYKGSEQSASSNTASITTAKDIGPAKPANLKITENGKDYLVLGWDKNTEANLSGYTITIYKDEKQIATAELAKEVAAYKFSNLSEATNYQVKLVAKDSAGKFSTPSWVFGATLPGATAKYVINKWVGLLAGVALALVVILILTIIKRHRAHKIKRIT